MFLRTVSLHTPSPALPVNGEGVLPPPAGGDRGGAGTRGWLLPTIFLPAILLAVAAWAADEPVTPEAFRQAMAERSGQLGKTGVFGFQGRDAVFFLVSDLRHYGRGPFWGEKAAASSEAQTNPDPLACILGFHAQLKPAGVTLIVMPVPGKAAVYPDKIEPKLASAQRLDAADQAFYELLRKDGIEVVDLLPDFLALRQKGVKVHCAQDTHWTPEAQKAAAAKVAALIRKQPWYASAPKQAFEQSSELVEFTGDIVNLVESQSGKKLDLPPEDVTVEKVSLDGKPLQSDPKSPVVLLGDSHCVVYHEPIEGGIGAAQAGLVDRLAAELGFPLDAIANAGSGVNPPRVTLARRRDNLAGKKCIVWCFASLELTESEQGWSPVTVVREAQPAPR